MYTLVTFATQWGSKYGGINSFNEDFLTAFAIAYNLNTQVICIAATATPEEIEDAAKSGVRLIHLLYAPQAKSFDASIGQAGVERLMNLNISFESDKTIWLGHDRITGEAAIAAAQLAGGRSAVIHHMSYDHYESYAENSQSAQQKTQTQAAMFQKANIVLAVGPLLRDAAIDRLGNSKSVYMLIPGLAEINPQEAPKTFVAFLSGRLSDDAARIKQGHLGIAAFATSQKEARENGMPEALRNQPKLLLRGVDFNNQPDHSSLGPETELKQFTEKYADEIVNLIALPYTTDRQQLYSELGRSSVALMPSWHEGFGLVAWEAIAAGVPLIISEKSGVYRFLKEKYFGAGTGCIYPVDIRGAMTSPFFHEADLKATVAKLKEIANNPGQARQQAGILRNLVSEYTWSACSEQAAKAFSWSIEKGSIPVVATSENASQAPSQPVPTLVPSEVEQTILKMPTKQWQPGTGMAASQLLRAEEGLLPFDPARQPEINTLNDWLDDTKRLLSVRLIVGAGGQGKTRLALELCQQRQARDWHTGFLDSNLEANKMSDIWQFLHKRNQPLLIVIDYAETRQPAFLGLLKAALQKKSDQPVRILLLARDGGEWWDNLPSKDRDCEAFLSGYGTTGPFPLPALYGAEPDRQDAYKKALQIFAKTLGANAPDLLPDLVDEHFERPLYIQMAALLALYGERPTTAQGLTKALLNHERRYWQGVLAKFGWPEPGRLAEQLLALTTLAGNFAIPKEAEPYWSAVNGKALRATEFSSLFRALAPLYPGTQGLQSLRPDLLGEALVAQALLRPDAQSLLDAVLSNKASHPIRRNALTVIARLSNQRLDLQETLIEAIAGNFHSCGADVVAVSKETTSRLPELAELAFVRLSPIRKSQIAGILNPLLIEESVQLARLDSLVCEFQVEKTREKFENKSNQVERMNDYAIALLRFALSLGVIGSYHEACEIDLKALELFRLLRTKDRQRFERNYAGLLSNYSMHLSETGKQEDAIAPAFEALEIRRQLAQKDPDRFESDYADSLMNYANRLSQTGKQEDAIAPAFEALEIRRRLVQENPDHFDPDYANSLHNYALHLSATGKQEDAIAPAFEALEIRRQLAQKDPDRFEPYYADTLNNYAFYLSEIGKQEESLGYDIEALGIYKRLAQKNPDRFDPDYANSLHNYASHLNDVGKQEDAIAPAFEALEIRKRLADQNLDRFGSDLFGIIYSVRFLSWLCNQSDDCATPDIEQLTQFIPSHRISLYLLYSAFVEGCIATDQAVRSNAFRKVLVHWTNISIGDKLRGEPYWLCAVVWFTKFDPAALGEIDLQIHWQQYVNRMNGNIQKWMFTVAQRLEFQLPTQETPDTTPPSSL
jgi:glycosyltransferase involved in cell wall biosynthesis